MMLIKIAKWLLLFMAFKVVVTLLVAQFYTDPRRDIAARKAHCAAFKPNTVFIGTSRTLYGIDPATFDSLNGGRTRSYNFGIFSLSAYSSLQLADAMLAENESVETIYIELSALDYSTVALPAAEVIPDAVFRTRVLADCAGMRAQTMAGSFLDGLNTTLFQAVSIAPQILSIKKALHPDNDPIEGRPDLQPNGHQSVASSLAKTNERLLANQTATGKLRNAGNNASPNAYFLSRINRLLTHARQRGRKVVFYFPNNITRGEYQTLSQVAPFLPAENLIPLPDQSALDALFKLGNVFDAHHLNERGAVIYTRYLQAHAK